MTQEITTKETKKSKLNKAEKLAKKYTDAKMALAELTAQRRELRRQDGQKKRLMFGDAVLADPALIAVVKPHLSAAQQAWLLAQEKVDQK